MEIITKISVAFWLPFPHFLANLDKPSIYGIYSMISTWLWKNVWNCIITSWKNQFFKKKFSKKKISIFFWILIKTRFNLLYFSRAFPGFSGHSKDFKGPAARTCLSQRYRYSANDHYKLAKIFLLPFMATNDDVTWTCIKAHFSISYSIFPGYLNDEICLVMTISTLKQ